MLTAGMSSRAVAIEFNVTFSTISHLQHLFENLAGVQAALQAQTMCNHCLRPATWTTDKTVGLHNRISAQTVRNRHREADGRVCMALCGRAVSLTL